MNYKGWIATVVACLLLTGCGGTSSDRVETEKWTTPSVVMPVVKTADEPGPAEPPAVEPEPDPAFEPEEPVKQDYYMDTSYIFRPKEESGEKKVVLLTFDDGPKEETMLSSILDTLDAHGAKAIFFINGYRAKQHPELLQFIHGRGQTIGNHAWDHIDLKKEPQEEMERQIDDVQTFVKETIGEAPRFFRPPFGSGGDAVKEKAARAGLLYMTWSNGSRDWVKGYDEPQKVISSVLEQLHPGSNILMHELPWTDEALDGLLTTLREKGYGFLDPDRIDPDYSKN